MSVRGRLAAVIMALAIMLTAITAAPQRAQASGYYTVSDSLAAIRWASARWHVNYWFLREIAQCESSLNPYAHNYASGASGLFQFLWGTWGWSAPQIGEEWQSPYNPYAAADVAAYLIHRGYSFWWACA